MTVPPVGPKDAKIVLLGEAPSWEEEKEGAPFVGPAGRQLDRMLLAAGIRRSDVYITNVWKEVIPGKGKEKDKFFFPGGAPSEEYLAGIIEVAAELSEIRPNVVVPLGNHALWALCQHMEIMRWRGSILSAKLIPGLKTIPTLHPAFYIHGYNANMHKELLGIWDLIRVKEESETREILLPVANFITNPSHFDIEEAKDRLLAGNVIVADTEWFAPEELAYVGFTNWPDWAICIPYDNGSNLEAIKEILASPIPKVWQNAMFDVVALARIGIPTNNVRHDTMVAWHSCWQDLREKGLAVIGSVLTRWPYYKDDLAFVRGNDVKGQEYCCRDCIVTAAAMEKIHEEEFDYTGGERGYEISMSIFNIFSKASQKGIRLNRDLLREKREFYSSRAEETEAALAKAIGHPLNCRSAPQVAKLVYDELGVRRADRSTSQDTLMDIAAGLNDPATKSILTAVIRVRQDRNVVSRYLHEGIVDIDERVRTNWNLAGTRSGRLSSTIPWWNGVALQTGPDDLRECLIPDEGYVFLGWDLAQAEARVVAVKTKDYGLLQDMEEGRDIHIQLATQLPFGLTYEELLAMCNTLGKDNVPARYIAKKCRHALNYMMGPDVFRQVVNKDYLDTNIGLGFREAREIHNAYKDLHPGLSWWWKEVQAQLRRTQSLTNCFGRVRRFLGTIDNCLTEAVSYEPQSTVADLTTLSIAAAAKRLPPSSQFFAHMHDGGLLQVLEADREESIEILRDCMTQEIVIDRHSLVIPVDVKFGYNWREMRYV